MQLSVEKAVEALERDGYVVFESFFSAEEADRAAAELNVQYKKDLSDQTCKTLVVSKTECTHITLNAYGHSPTLDRMVEKILTDPISGATLKALVGDYVKLRGYNVQRMTGEVNRKPSIGVLPNPHEWHRDSPGEIGIAIFLSDIEGYGSGATSVVQGSHRFPFCPRWNCMFGPPFLLANGRMRASDWLMHWTWFSRRLARLISPRVTGIYGKRGDFYIFINDVWHGREESLFGNKSIKVMLGAFPTDFDFPDLVTPPPAEVLAKLPPALRAAAGQTNPVNGEKNTILRRMLAERAQTGVHYLFRASQIERHAMNSLAFPICQALSTLRHFKHTLREFLFKHP